MSAEQRENLEAILRQSAFPASISVSEQRRLLRELLSAQPLASYSGGRTVRDFIEVPTQMFEEWTWSREVLDRFARHWQTGEKIPDALFAAMLRSRSFGRGLATQRQLFMATLDFEYHSREPGFDTTKVYAFKPFTPVLPNPRPSLISFPPNSTTPNGPN